MLSSDESTLKSQLGGLVWGEHSGGDRLCSAPSLYVASTQPL